LNHKYINYINKSKDTLINNNLNSQDDDMMEKYSSKMVTLNTLFQNSMMETSSEIKSKSLAIFS